VVFATGGSSIKTVLCILCTVVLACVQLSAQSDHPLEIPDDWGVAKPLAVIQSEEGKRGPGIWFQVSSDEELVLVRWEMRDSEGLLPIAFRETPGALFFFPESGDFEVRVSWTDVSGETHSESMDLSIDESGTTFFQTTLAESSFNIPQVDYVTNIDVWNQLELTGARSKPFAIRDIPWYAPASAAAVGGGIWLLASDRDEEDEPPLDTTPALIVNDLVVQLTCPDGTEINPLENDEGDGMTVTGVSGLTGEIGTFNPPSTIEIFPGLSESVQLTYSVIDNHGQSGTASVIVEVQLPVIDVPEIEREVTAGEQLSGNVLEGASCSGCQVIEFSQGVSGTVNISPDGNYQYDSDGNYSGWVEVPFEVADECGQSAQSVVRIWVEAVCDAGFQVEATAEDCGLENGRITVSPEQEGDFQIRWQDGSEIFERAGLSSGSFSYTITDLNNDCEYEGDAEVGENPVEHWGLITTNAGNCLETPDAQWTFDFDGPGSPVVQLEGPETTLTANLQSWSGSYSLTEIWEGEFFSEGEYTLTVYDETAGEECASQQQISLEELPLEMVLIDVETTLLQGEEVSGNLLANDLGTGLEWTAIDEPDFGEIEVAEDGAFTYWAPEDQSGEIMMEYTAVDTCGQEKTATLRIHVLPCDIAVDIEISHPDCGMTNGSISAETNGNEDLIFDWSNGVDSSFIENLPPGTYHLTITDTATQCTETYEFELENLSPYAVNDTFEVLITDTLVAKIISNDIGHILSVESHSEPDEGSLELDSTGEMTYIPGGNFIGEVDFFYVLVDSCGGKDTGLVFIEILPLECEREYEITIDTADCGLSNGAAYFEIETPCDYELVWHDESTADTLKDQSAGDYEVVLILSGEGFESDTITIPYTIPERAPKYIESFSLENPSCIEEGEIELELMSLGDGDFELIVEGPEEGEVIETMESAIALSEFLDIDPGEYLIVVRDKSLECELSDSLVLELVEETLPVEVQDKEIEVFSGDSVGFNLLANALGSQLRVTDVEPPDFGNLMVDSLGLGSFKSTIPEKGVIEVQFFVEDVCGTLDTGLLTIVVELPPCDFEVEFISKNPDCDFSNGSLEVVPDPPGDYTFQWSNGAQGPLIEDLSAGEYEVTITNQLLQCSLIFNTTLEELEPNWITDSQFFSEGCYNGPEITLNLRHPEGRPVRVTVNGPGISNFSFFVLPQAVDLSDYFGYLEAGLYQVTALPQGYASRCTQSIEGELHLTGPSVELSLASTTNPSGPNQSDGSIAVSMTGGSPSYSLYLNNEFHGTTSGQVYEFDDLPVGTYEVQVFDDLNCASEVLTVTLGTANSPLVLRWKNGVGNAEMEKWDWELTVMENPWDENGEDVSTWIYWNSKTAVELNYYPLDNLPLGWKTDFRHLSGVQHFNWEEGSVGINIRSSRLSMGPVARMGLGSFTAETALTAGYRRLSAHGFQGAGFSNFWDPVSMDGMELDFSFSIYRQWGSAEVYGGVDITTQMPVDGPVSRLSGGLNWRF